MISPIRLLCAVTLLHCSSTFAPRPHTSLRRAALLRRPGAETEDAAAPPPANTQADSAARMRSKLKKEAEYPLFFPLLGASAVIGGKGLTDALLTVAKVAAGMRGASFADTFFGLPVLGIDAACVVVGASLAKYTWDNQRPPE